MLFFMIAKDAPDALQLRLDTRPLHLDHLNSLGKKHFDWMVTHMADLAIRLAKSPEEATATRYAWYKMTQDAKK